MHSNIVFLVLYIYCKKSAKLPGGGWGMIWYKHMIIVHSN